MLIINFDTLNFLANIFLALLALIPFVLNLKYSYQFKLVDYILLVIYFSYWGPFMLFFESTGSWAFSEEVFPYASAWQEPFFLMAFTNICECIPIYLIAIRSNWEYPPLWSYLLSVYGLSIALVVIVDNNQTLINNYPLLIWGIWLSRIFFYGASAYIFYNTRLINPTKRSLRAKYIWVTSTGLITVAMIFVMIVCGLLGIQQINSDPLAVVQAYIFFAMWFIAFLFIIVLHAFFPEAMLLSDEQLRNAKKIYKIIYSMKKKENRINELGMSLFKQYLEDLPAEFKIKET